VGDYVLIKNHNLPQNQSRKPQPKYIGPAIIISLPKPFPDQDPTYAEVLNFSPPTRVHHVPICDMKPYYYRTDAQGFNVQVAVEELANRNEQSRENRVQIPRDLLIQELPPDNDEPHVPREMQRSDNMSFTPTCESTVAVNSNTSPPVTDPQPEQSPAPQELNEHTFPPSCSNQSSPSPTNSHQQPEEPSYQPECDSINHSSDDGLYEDALPAETFPFEAE